MKKIIFGLTVVALIALLSAKTVFITTVTTNYKTYVIPDSGVVYVDLFNISSSSNTIAIFRIDSAGGNLLYDSVLLSKAIDSIHPDQRRYERYVWRGDTVRVKSNMNGALTISAHF